MITITKDNNSSEIAKKVFEALSKQSFFDSSNEDYILPIKRYIFDLIEIGICDLFIVFDYDEHVKNEPSNITIETIEKDAIVYFDTNWKSFDHFLKKVIEEVKSILNYYEHHNEFGEDFLERYPKEKEKINKIKKVSNQLPDFKEFGFF